MMDGGWWMMDWYKVLVCISQVPLPYFNPALVSVIKHGKFHIKGTTMDQ
jgi:hypothetical protein